MPVKKRQVISNFRGVNDARHPALIGDSECVELKNCVVMDGKLRQRPPMTLYRSAVAASGSTGALGLTLDTGAWAFITLGQTDITNSTLSAGTGTALNDAMSLAFATSDTPWRVTQYKNYGYAVRPDLNYIVRFDDTDFWSTGIAAPTTNAVGATSATAGAVETGDYYGVYTFVDADGVESAPSPISAKWTQGASKKVDWSSVDVSTNPRVTARNLYRTLPGHTGEYFYVGQIADNSATTFTENTTVPEMGDLAPVDNLVPPNEYWLDIAVCFERLWVTDGQYVYGSAAEDPDSWPAENVYAFNPDDGQPIVAIRRVGTDLLIFKTNSVWALSQSLGAFEFLPRVVDEKNGAIATQGVAVGDGKAFYYSGEAVFQSDGRSPSVDVSTPKLAYFRTIPDANKENAVSGIYTKYGWFVVALPADGIDRTPRIWVYDYRQGNWFEISLYKTAYVALLAGPWFGAVMPVFLSEIIDAYGVPRLFSNFWDGSTIVNSLIDVFSDGDPDANTGDAGVVVAGFYRSEFGDDVSDAEINSTIKFRGQNFGAPGAMHAISRMLLNCNSIGTAGSETFTVKVYQDGSAAPLAAATRTGLELDGGMDWKNFALMTRSRKAALSIVEITRSSLYDLAISAVEFVGELWNWEPPEGT